MLAKCLAVEWADFARVNCVSPGYIRTEMIGEANPDWSAQWTRSIPGGRFAEPFELKGVGGGVPLAWLTLDLRLPRQRSFQLRDRRRLYHRWRHHAAVAPAPRSKDQSAQT